MKRLKRILIIIVALSAVNSCFDPEPEDSMIEYITKNISVHNVKLIVFYKSSDNINKDTIYTITPNEEIIQRYINRYVDCPFGLPADSAYIVFDNLRQIIHRRNDGRARNIIDINSYEGGLVKGEWYRYQYYITNEDYDNAIEIK